MEGIDLVLEVGLAILAEENRAFDLVLRLLAALDLEAEGAEVFAEAGEDGVTGETLARDLVQMDGLAARKTCRIRAVQGGGGSVRGKLVKRMFDKDCPSVTRVAGG